jgi:hypothetical protein
MWLSSDPAAEMVACQTVVKLPKDLHFLIKEKKDAEN